jgi:hypothetical protein
MAEPKAEQKPAKENKTQIPDADTRYRYLGFEVFPKSSGKFWKSDAEIDQHLAKVRSITSFSDWDRDFSLIKTPDITASDRIVLILSNVVLLLSMFLPWLSYWTAQGQQTAIWFGTLGVLGGALGGAFAVGTGVGLAGLCGLVVFICTPLLAVLGLVALLNKGKDADAYVRRLRFVLRLNYVGLGAWLLGLVLVLVGGNITPLVNAGLTHLGESFTIVTLFDLISYGAIIPVAMFYLNALKSNDL